MSIKGKVKLNLVHSFHPRYPFVYTYVNFVKVVGQFSEEHSFKISKEEVILGLNWLLNKIRFL